MPSNFDKILLAKAKRLGGFKYKRDVINTALKEFIDRRKQMAIIEMFRSLITYLATIIKCAEESDEQPFVRHLNGSLA